MKHYTDNLNKKPTETFENFIRETYVINLLGGFYRDSEYSGSRDVSRFVHPNELGKLVCIRGIVKGLKR